MIEGKRPAGLQSGAKRYPEREDWERFRNLITQLYVVEDMKLRDVMNIMSNEHGHHGT